MISEKLYDQIEREGKKKDYKIRECYGERDKEGNYSFIIRLIPTNNILAKINEPTEMIDISGKRIDPRAYGN